MRVTDPALRHCRKGKEFVAYAESHGARVEHGGRHVRLFNERGESVSVPVHGNGKELGTGLRCAIVKAFVRLGFTAALVVFLMDYLQGALK